MEDNTLPTSKIVTRQSLSNAQLRRVAFLQQSAAMQSTTNVVLAATCGWARITMIPTATTKQAAHRPRQLQLAPTLMARPPTQIHAPATLALAGATAARPVQGLAPPALLANSVPARALCVLRMLLPSVLVLRLLVGAGGAGA